MAREKSAERPKKQTEADRAVHEAAVAATLEEVDYEYEPTMSDGDMFGDAPAKKAENFWPSFNRLMSLLKPEWVGMTWVTLLVVVSVALVVIAPRILGQATDVIFSGAVGTIDSSGKLTPGTGIDFVELGRLLRYFDTRQRGDLMSRVTNDVDNIQTALQQAFSQLIQSVLMVVGIGIMMFIVSWQLALIALISIPLSGVIAGVIGSRSQKLFKQQWASTGNLNGHIEESYSGLDLVRAFGRDAVMLDEFDARNSK